MASKHSGITLDSLDFCEESGTYTAKYDPESTSPSMAVVGAVADALDTDALELDPLFETVDTDALDGLLGETGSDQVHLSFTFADCEITMSGDGRIRISLPQE